MNYIPTIIGALVLLLIGLVVGGLLQTVVVRVARSLKLDEALKHAHVDSVVSKAGFSLNTPVFLGVIAKWFVVAVFLVAAVDALGLTQVNVFLTQVLEYLPNVLVAVLILLIAAIIAEAVGKIVAGASQVAESGQSAFLATVARYAIWTFAVLAAVHQLGIAQVFVQTLFMGIVVAFSLAAGLAFGLGGQDAAKEYIADLKQRFRRE